MIFVSEAGNNLQKYYESLLTEGFENFTIIESFLLYVLIKHPEVLESFDNDSKLPF